MILEKIVKAQQEKNSFVKKPLHGEHLTADEKKYLFQFKTDLKETMKEVQDHHEGNKRLSTGREFLNKL